jgi:anti-anti-sigma factor
MAIISLTFLFVPFLMMATGSMPSGNEPQATRKATERTSMKYAIDNKANGMNIALAGRITFADFADMNALIATIKEKSGRMVTLDLTAVEFIDSSALGMLLLIRDAVGGQNRLSIQNAKGQVKRIMSLARFPMAA